MPSLLGPSHHVYYAALHRRRLWLSHLAAAYGAQAHPAFAGEKGRVDSRFARMFARLSAADHLGIAKPLPLSAVLDDTPVGSFLSNLGDDLDAYEYHLFSLMRPDDELDRASTLWGREIAQECLAAAPNRPVRSLKGVFELILLTLAGGEFAWKPLLLRSYTDSELQYELRSCPHRRGYGTGAEPAGTAVADLACRLEARVFEGFARAWIPDAGFTRHCRPSYCLDELNL